MEILFKKYIKSILFFLIKLLRVFTKKYDKKISLQLSKLNWSSKIYNKSLEVTTTVGCAMMCEYCPQTNYKKSGASFPRVLSFDVFKKVMDNVDKEVKIHWTGFSEPLHCKEFPEMSSLVDKKGHKQHISTTLFGRENSKEFFLNEGNFDDVVLHLPDCNNLMKLKVDEKYIKFLIRAIKSLSKKVKKENFQIMVIGEDFHPEIREVINNSISEKIISGDNIYVRKHLVTRAGQVDDKEGFRRNIIDIDLKHRTNDLYYCSYGRLNKGVLLTNGDMAICCNDYSIEHNVGSLILDKLDNLYMHEKLFENNDFIKGEKSLCKRCEFYQKL